MRKTLTDEQKAGLKRLMRHGLRFAPAVLLVLAVLWLLLPQFVAADRLAAALRSELRIRAGLDLETTAPAALSLWPSPALVFGPVTIRRADGSILLEADRLTTGFSLANALSASPYPDEIEIDRPRFRLADAETAALPADGNDLRALAAALAPRSGPALRALAHRAFGTLTIRDGQLVAPAGDATRTLLEAIGATLTWPDIDETFSGAVNATFAGERIGIDLATPQFARLLSGGDVPMTLKLSVPGGTASIDGTGSLAPSGFLTGQLAFEASDLQRLFSWGGLSTEGLEALKRASARARLSTAGYTLRFDQLAFSINDTEARGIMDLTLRPETLPKFTGTLAFRDFDLGDIGNLTPLASLFSASPEGAAVPLAAAFDIRLSADTVRIGQITLRQIAASMLLNPDHALLDIGDSSFDGGRLTGRLSHTAKDEKAAMRLALSIRAGEMAQIGAQLGLDQIWPGGPGALDIDLFSNRPFADTRRADLSGRVVMTANGGHLRRFAAGNLRELATRPLPLRLDGLDSDAFDYDRLDARLTIDRGAVSIDSAVLVNAEDRLQFSGALSADDQLDLTARLTEPATTGTPPPPLAITLGGTREAPLVTAVAMPDSIN